MAAQRPGGVTLVAVIAWLNGLFTIIGGIFHIFTWSGWVSIILGVITIAVSLGLFRGNNLSRILLTIVFVLDLAVAAYNVFTTGNGFWGPLVAGAIALIGLVLLYTQKANAFFR
ncbi:hypothetical protein [Microbacterium hominis]|uniref:Uncharacterized protein n=1 Tax=Microbacterium hominis TaxID=162426 RepID=A0A7D4PVT6_9MICO|nr:hypothetical protein [Microbacterium hominis]QKJ20054.1 hypothetical protein HQM25_12290 [Microbacterium hominis]